jgi:hypothetical protein
MKVNLKSHSQKETGFVDTYSIVYDLLQKVKDGNGSIEEVSRQLNDVISNVKDISGNTVSCINNNNNNFNELNRSLNVANTKLQQIIDKPQQPQPVINDNTQQIIDIKTQLENTNKQLTTIKNDNTQNLADIKSQLEYSNAQLTEIKNKPVSSTTINYGTQQIDNEGVIKELENIRKQLVTQQSSQSQTLIQKNTLYNIQNINITNPYLRQNYSYTQRAGIVSTIKNGVLIDRKTLKKEKVPSVAVFTSDNCGVESTKQKTKSVRISSKKTEDTWKTRYDNQMKQINCSKHSNLFI